MLSSNTKVTCCTYNISSKSILKMEGEPSVFIVHLKRLQQRTNIFTVLICPYGSIESFCESFPGVQKP
uniref:USP domain-containing protein n=1 Tax=Anguilla anguilla TaxID=7936 RepID=A0A0E9XE31_ANGAN